MNDMLAGIRVLELGHLPAVRYCGRLLALSGATVERTSNTPKDTARAGAALDEYLNLGKRLIGASTGPLTSTEVDIVVADPDFAWDRVGRDVLTGTVDPFGPQGTRRGWKGPEIVLSSLGGATNYTRSDSGQPVYGFGRRFQYLAGEYLYIVLASMLGLGTPPDAHHPRVRVANDEVVVGLLPYGTTQYAYNGTTTTVEQSGPRFLVECVDGHLCIYAGGAWRNLALLLAGHVAEHDARFKRFGERFDNVDLLADLVQLWARDKTVHEAIELADRAAVAVAPCYDLDAALADPSLRANGVLADREVGGRLVAAAGLAYHVREAS